MNQNNAHMSCEVEERLKNIFKRRLNLEIKDNNEQLFGFKIGLSARDLIYICLDIEKEFNISIDDECIDNHRLTTFDSIKSFVLSRCLEGYKAG
jgi:peptide maturation system acyl carrier-related protein